MAIATSRQVCLRYKEAFSVIGLAKFQMNFLKDDEFEQCRWTLMAKSAETQHLKRLDINIQHPSVF